MDMQPLGIVAILTLIAVTAVCGDRYLSWHGWRRALVAYTVRFPAGISPETVADMLAVVSGSARKHPVVIETYADSRAITHHLLVTAKSAPATVGRLTVAIPGIRITAEPEYLVNDRSHVTAVELRTSRTRKPLSTSRPEASLAALLASLYPLGKDESVQVQWIFRGSRYLPPSDDETDARDVAHKQDSPLVEAVGRVGVTASHSGRARMLIAGVVGAVGIINAPGVSLTVRRVSSAVVARRVSRRMTPWTIWRTVLNVDELAAALGVPIGDITVPGLQTGTARQLPPPPTLPRKGTVIGLSNYPGMTTRPIALRDDDRLRHMLAQGPTGVGKSTLIARMALQDITRGHGVIVIDPKSDLIDEILSRIPESRIDDVVVVDAANIDHPIGFNLLAAGRGIHERELVVERVAHVLAQVWQASWGPRTADVVRACLLTLTNVRVPDGSAYTLTEIPALLTDPQFRRSLLARGHIPESVREFWAAYESMSDGERAQVIGPTMHRIRQLTTRTALRLMLGQTGGIDLSILFRERKIILVPLAKGVIGTDAAHLLGSLLVAFLWQETLRRAKIPADRRRPTFAYLDEFQEFLHFGTGEELADMLAQARGLGLGLILGYQYLGQLSPAVLAAVLGTVRTQLVFQTEYDDARKLAARFAPLTIDDLCNADAYEWAVRPCVGGQTLRPVTGLAFPLDERLRDPAELLDASALRYGMPSADVETARMARITSGRAMRRVGRLHGEGQ